MKANNLIHLISQNDETETHSLTLNPGIVSLPMNRSVGSYYGLTCCNVCGAIIPDIKAFSGEDKSLSQRLFEEHVQGDSHKAFLIVKQKYNQLASIYGIEKLKKRKAGAGSSTAKRK